MRYAAIVRELMGGAYPELTNSAPRSEVAGLRGGELRAHARAGHAAARRADRRARAADEEGIAAEDAFTLHDTYGFPFDLTRELVAEHGLGVDPEGFER